MSDLCGVVSRLYGRALLTPLILAFLLEDSFHFHPRVLRGIFCKSEMSRKEITLLHHPESPWRGFVA